MKILKTTAKAPEDIAKAVIKQVNQIFPVVFGMTVVLDKVYRLTINNGGKRCPPIEREIEYLYRACREGTAEFDEAHSIADEVSAVQKAQTEDHNRRWGTDDQEEEPAICHLVERAWGPLAIILQQQREDPSLKRAAIWSEGLQDDQRSYVGDFLWGARATVWRVMLFGGGLPTGKKASMAERIAKTPVSGEVVRKIFVEAVNGAKDWLRTELTRQNPSDYAATRLKKVRGSGPKPQPHASLPWISQPGWWKDATPKYPQPSKKNPSRRRRRRSNPPIGPRTMVQYEVRFDAGPAIRTAGQRCFRPEHGRVEAQNTLVLGLRDNRYVGTGYYELYDVSVPGRPVIERKRLSPPTADNAKWHWVDEIGLAGTEPAKPTIRVTKTTLTPRQFSLEAHLGDRPVGVAVFAVDRSPCPVRDKLLSRASHGHSVGAWHLLTISTDPGFPAAATALLGRALIESTGSGLTSGPCHGGVPATAPGYDADAIFQSGAFQAMANVQEAGGYYVAFRRV